MALPQLYTLKEAAAAMGESYERVRRLPLVRYRIGNRNFTDRTSINLWTKGPFAGSDALFAAMTLDKLIARPDQLESSIYFVASHCYRYCKIGVASNLVQRVSSLQNGNPYQLFCIAQFCGGYKGERWLHERYARLRHRGEWFRTRGELTRLLNGIAHIYGRPHFTELATARAHDCTIVEQDDLEPYLKIEAANDAVA